MYCTKCGNELRIGDNYCPRCGNRTAASPLAASANSLRLDKRNGKIAGVCAGFARHLGMDVILVRVLWLGVALCTGGLGFLAYLAAWIIVPGDHGLDTTDLTVHQFHTS